MRANTTPAGELRSIRKTYGAITAVDGVSLHVTPGEILALAGPHGAGKTTTLEILAGLRRPDCGHALINGTIPAGSFKARLHVGVQQQHSRLPAGLKVREAIRSASALYLNPGPVKAIVNRLGLDPYQNCTVDTLSTQWQRYLDVALACIGRPSLLILDDPTNGFDSQARADMWHFFGELRNAGVAIITSTHDPAEAEAFADRIIVLTHGRVATYEATSDVLATVNEAPQSTCA
ncbi:ABC transporter ATP-binding protein [Dermatophilus congolensis]|uniref:Daunorubicin/doxorubicin resistance ATP-binding protein DrrA n=1 Tax=Dermatophilus congolensis TaxID=1863 RepID=A0A239VKC2_9MICO|nr:ABC transporter ATP-binding protein [Dermatophilus congolensis]MBO3129191.1 ABC transporter ATP-binding protein [Dermatophilus congolensis]MBO3132175.1 ABC transporter ATP-binding protein [Dermatophilus congolensis]MBO3133669.1 ABC transporter ATP-binding protein [Dermatophilus congolensis]MBO3135902.1 ABC transporter ATP-binding protein [Dermatophilus congolensis]MBO3138141.1 ABC transporter ATP-binding protein [Dermatophilus congolensis]